MDIKELFKNQISSISPDIKLKKLFLNQLAIYAVEGDEKKFEILLEKIHTVLDYYSIYDTYVLNSDSGNGRITEVALEEESPDHCSFLQFAITNLPTNFALKIAQKAVDENLTVYNKYSPILKNNILIQECLLRDKPEVLELLVDKKFINEDDIYNCLFFYKYRVLTQYSKQLGYDNPEVVFKVFDKFADEKIQAKYNLHDLIMTLEDIKNIVPYQEYKNEIKKYVVPLLLNIKENPSSSSTSNEHLKRIISNFIIDGVLEIHTSFEKVDGKFVMEQGNSMVCDKFNLREDDINKILMARVNNLSAKLKDKSTSEPKKMKI